MRVFRPSRVLMCDFPTCGGGSGLPDVGVCRKLPTGIYVCL
ncbi:MAG TPA: hypothetical protein VI997_07440 [Candidatus Thermoplasmatota archaeon]|nr:hypothetical protein [Candidatus Thermoplasmatota archaeon]